MRTISSNIKAIMQLDEISYVYLVKIEAKSGTIRDTTSASAVTIDSETYTPSGDLFSIEAPRLSTVVDREVYKIVYADPNFEKRALFEANLTSTKITVTLCFENTTGSYLDIYAPGALMTQPTDLVIAYKGTVDTHGYTIDPNEGTVLAAIECASPMASLGLSRPFYTSKEAMKQVNANDTAFDQVYVGSKRIGYAWGKR